MRTASRLLPNSFGAKTQVEHHTPPANAPAAQAGVAASQPDDAAGTGDAPPLAPGTMDKLLRLAALRLDGDEQRNLESDLARIIALIDVMRGVDTAGVAPLAHPLEVAQPMRPDVVTEAPADPARLQQGAPAVRDGLYLVPRVVE